MISFLNYKFEKWLMSNQTIALKTVGISADLQ